MAADDGFLVALVAAQGAGARRGAGAPTRRAPAAPVAAPAAPLPAAPPAATPTPAARAAERTGAAAADARRRRRADARLRLLALRRAPTSTATCSNAALKKLFSRPALQRHGRARHLHRRLRQARPAAAGDAAQDDAVERARPVRRRLHRRPHGAPTTASQPLPMARPPPMAQSTPTLRTATDPVPMKTLICDCNRTMPLDGPALAPDASGASADGLETVHSRCAGARPAPSSAPPSATRRRCSSRARRRAALPRAERARPKARPASPSGRSASSTSARPAAGRATRAAATPKIAALIAAAQLPPPEPVPTVELPLGRPRARRSARPTRAERAAALLADKLDVSVLLADRRRAAAGARRRRARRPARRAWPAGSAPSRSSGTSANPIDLDLCTRCNACVDACPERRDRLRLPGRPRALHGAPRLRARLRAPPARSTSSARRRRVAERFDLVLDLRRRRRAFAMHQPPQGYFHAGADDAALAAAVLALRDARRRVREAEVLPTTSSGCARTAATSAIGCTACIDVCSARAIRSDASQKGKPRAQSGAGRGIVVEPHLCVGCGACTTVCPSGALTLRATPRPADQARALRTMLGAYAHGRRPRRRAADPQPKAPARSVDRAARPRGAHRAPAAAACRRACCRSRSGTPRAVGLDLWLAAIALRREPGLGAAHRRRGAASTAPRSASRWTSRRRCSSGLGYARPPLSRCRGRRRPAGARRRARRAAGRRASRARAAFAVQADKRATLELAIDHLLAQAPRAVPDEIALPAAGAPVRQPRRRRRDVHAVPGLRRRLPVGGARRQPRAAAAEVHREELRPVRPVRDAPAPRTRSRSSRGCCSPTAAARAASRAC